MKSESTTATETALDALTLLTLPPLERLTQEQVRGAACIWCKTALRTATAVDLHERRHRRLDGHYSTFPRACHPCTRTAAHDALTTHHGTCEQCVDDTDACDTATALRSLAREHQQ